MRQYKPGRDADECVPVLLYVPVVLDSAATFTGRLLRVLLVLGPAMSAKAGRSGFLLTERLAPAITDADPSDPRIEQRLQRDDITFVERCVGLSDQLPTQDPKHKGGRSGHVRSGVEVCVAVCPTTQPATVRIVAEGERDASSLGCVRAPDRRARVPNVGQHDAVWQLMRSLVGSLACYRLLAYASVRRTSVCASPDVRSRLHPAVR